MKLAWKLSIPQMCIVVCVGLASFVVVNSSLMSLREQYAKGLVENCLQRIAKDIEADAQEALRQASVFVRLPSVVQAYEMALEGNIDDPFSPQSQAARELLRKDFAPFLDSYRERHGTTLHLHFHLPNARSLVRLWRDKNTWIQGEALDISDDLAAYRPTVVEVNKSGKAVNGIELGNSGLAIRGVVPVKALDGRQLGSAEILYDMRSVLDAVQEPGKIEFILYVSKDRIVLHPDPRNPVAIAAGMQDPEKNPPKGDFVRVITPKDNAVDALITPELLSRGKYEQVIKHVGSTALAALPVRDYRGTQVAVLACVMSTAEATQLVRTAVITLSLMLAAMVIAPSLSLLLGLRMLVIGPLNKIKAKMQDIAENRADFSEQILSSQKDEIGALARLFNILTAKFSAMLDEVSEANERAHLMLDATPVVATLWDRNLNRLDCNQEALKFFAVQSKQEYLERFFDFSPECQPDGQNSVEKGKELLSKAFEEGYCRFEWMHQTLHGEPIPSEITLVRVKYKEDFIVVGYTHDLRARKTAMEQIAANRAKSAFLATMSHEIRTPMNAILGITEMQLQQAALSTNTKEAFGRIYTSGYTLLGIINDLLDLSKIEAGKLELMPAPYEVASLLSDTLHLNALRIGSKPIEFTLQVDEDMPLQLFGDELRIKQILNNLLSNAFKYTREGEVTLSVSAECGSGAEESEATLVCRVRDTGMGMTKEQVDRLGEEEYARFHMAANRLIEGTGLGMNITRHLVRMMRGEIFVESELDRGSTFTVRLPQGKLGSGALGEELAANLRRFNVSSPQRRMAQILREPMPYGSVLIVDDLETNLYVSKGLMAPYGLSIDTALSGFEAINNIRGGNEYDIVFMDHMMPRMDGVETTRILRELGYDRPIVALTANVVVGQAEMFRESGFDGFISKPVDLRQLNLVLNRLIRDKQPPELLEAARRQQGAPQAVDEARQPLVDPKLAKIFVRDAEKAMAMLEAIYMNQYRRDDDMHLFVVNVHAMKSALANIGESELAALAYSLEQAARMRDVGAMSDETPAFLNGLRAVVESIRPKDEDGETADEDQAYLREKLLAVQAACADYDKKAVKDALAELQQKVWSRQTREQLEIIAEHLLHSEFEELADLVGRLCQDSPKE